MMLVDDEGERIIDMDYYAQLLVPPSAAQTNSDPGSSEPGAVSCLYRCKSADAKELRIYNIARKLSNGGQFDIGGTYTETGEPEFWFYCSTSVCPGYNNLLNLFVCHRKVGSFSVGVSNSNELTHLEKQYEKLQWSVSPDKLSWHTFKSAQPNEIYHIKTFCFNKKCMKANLYIPISITVNSNQTINNDMIMSIKLQHDLSRLLSKKEKTDFVLVSASGMNFPVHKIILVAHSPVLRNLVKDTENELFIDIQDSDMELILEFLYTGTIKDISKQDCINLLNIADKFKLNNLFILTQYALVNQINIDSAVEIALLSQKYKLENLQQEVFNFINDNPKVMQTKSWKELKDVQLTKQLIEHIYEQCI